MATATAAHWKSQLLKTPQPYLTTISSMKEEYGLFVWPSSLILAEYVWQQRSPFSSGINVLEVLDNMRKVCELNNVKCEDEFIFNLQPQNGADVLYNSSAFDNLFTTVKFLLENSHGSFFFTSCHNRSGHHLIEFLMVKWGLKCLKLLNGFSFLSSWKASGLSGNIQFVEIDLSDVEKN